MKRHNYLLLIFVTRLLFSCNSENAIELTNKGIELLKKKDDWQANFYFTQAIEDDENYGRAYFYRAKVSDEESAIKDLSTAILKGYNVEESYIERGIIKGKLNNIKGALKDFNIALRMDPQNTYINQLKGNMYYDQNNYSQALYFYNITDPSYDDHEFYEKRGFANYQMKKYFEALKDANSAIELSDLVKKTKSGWESKFGEYDSRLNSWDYYFRAELKYQLGDIAGATMDIDKSISTDFMNYDAIRWRGILKYNKKDFNGALNDLEKVINSNQKDGLAYYYRGKIKIQKNEMDSACLDLSKAGELGVEEAYELIKQTCN
jgi:tetratricopeptide (TPR) repeat protein